MDETRDSGDPEVDKLFADVRTTVQHLHTLLDRIPAALAYYRRCADSADGRADVFKQRADEHLRTIGALRGEVERLRSERDAGTQRERELQERLRQVEKQLAECTPEPPDQLFPLQPKPRF